MVGPLQSGVKKGQSGAKVGRPFFSMIEWPDKKVHLHGPLIDCPRPRKCKKKLEKVGKLEKSEKVERPNQKSLVNGPLIDCPPDPGNAKKK